MLRSVMPNPAPDGDPENITKAWSGATFDTKGNRMLLWGGGHNDYAGNELYAFSINTLSWSRLTSPSSNTGGDEGSGAYPDGRPRAGHSYNTLAYAENTNRMYIVGLAAVWFNGGSPGNSFQFDLDSGNWSSYARNPRLGDVKGGMAVYDSATNNIWYRSGGQAGLTKYDTTTGNWTDYGDDGKFVEIYATAAIDPQRRLMVSVGGYNGRQLYVWDLANPSADPTTPNTAGPRDVEGAQSPGFVFDSSSRKFVGWLSGTSVYVLDPSNWTWSKIPAASNNAVTPGSPAANGTYGRWRYVPSKNAFMLVNAVDQNVYFYKLSNAAPVTDPTVTFSAAATTVALQGSTTLTWSVTNANACTASGAWSGSKATSGTQGIGPLATTQTYTLSCTNTAGGAASKSVTVNVTQTTPAPTVTLQAAPTTVTRGSSTTLTWSSTNSTGCVSSGAWAGNKAASGSTQSAALQQNSTFTLQCTGAGGSGSASATVQVTDPTQTPAAPTLTFNANQTSLTANSMATLTWTTQNATSCTAAGSWSGSKSTAATESIGPLSAGSPEYDLTCTGTGGSVTKSVTLTVTAASSSPPPPTSSATDSSGGGGAFGLVTVLGLFVALLARMRRYLRPRALAALAILIAGPVVASDITTVTLISKSASAQTNVPVTFGQVFRPGDVPAGSSVTATTNSGGSVTLQVDKKATHADGSLRHAVLTARLGNLGSNGTEILHLSTGSAASGTAVSLSDLLATSFDAEVRLNVGGTTYTASARSLLQSGTPEQWLSGPLASEWIVGGPVKTSGGVAHKHLAAYFHVRAYAGQPINRVRVDVVIENGWTLVTSPGAFNYTIDTLIGGSSVGTRTINHFPHTRWHERYWWGSDPQIYVKQDKDYLQATKAVPHYPELTPSASFLNSLPTDYTPMQHGLLTQHMPNTGAQDAIGPLPRWTSAYVVSTDERAYLAMLSADDSAGSYGIHYRDEATGKPVSIADHPTLSLQTDGDVPDNVSDGNPNEPDAAHQPSVAFVAYLVTGDYYYLEELQFWTSWNHLFTNNNYRENAKGIFVLQVRGQAWSIRNLAQAAYATPDSHRYKSLLVASVGYNLASREAEYPDDPNVNKLGAIQSYDGYQNFAPWMDDFYTWTMGYLVDLGFNANKMRDFKAKFPVGRMGLTDYCYIQAGAYHLTTGTSDSNWWPDFATLYQKNFGTLGSCALGAVMEGYPDQPDGYTSNLRPALAVAVDAGIPGAAAAWDRLVQSRPQPDYNDLSNWAVMPRGATSGAPSLTLAANPTTVQSGQSSTLTWTSSGATSCTASGSWSGSKATSGSEAITNITASKSFTLSCTGNGQTVQRSASITVGTSSPPPPPPPAPTVTLNGAPQSITGSGKATLTWSSTNATSCTASGGWSGSKATSGSEQTATLSATASYSLSCTGAGGTQSASTTVTVTPASTPVDPPSNPTPPTTPPSGNASSDSGGGGALDFGAVAALFAAWLLRTARRRWIRPVRVPAGA
jgi:hypothetical protein